MKIKEKIHILPRGIISPPERTAYPCLILEVDSWNDFGFTATFNVYMYPERATQIKLGRVKIADKSGQGYRPDTLPTSLEELPRNTCSIGQSFDYYRTLYQVGERARIGLLRSMRDVIEFQEMAEGFTELEIFETSLLRAGEPNTLWEKGKELIDHPADGPFEGHFEATLPYCMEQHMLPMRFLDTPLLPNRINIVVGKNGTGKTQLLRKLAETIGGAAELPGRFHPNRPSFSKAMAISYSVFDDYPNNRASYEHYGIFDTNRNVKNRPQLVNDISASLKRIHKLGRNDWWIDAVEYVFSETQQHFTFDNVGGLSAEDTNRLILKSSSGQLVALSIISDVCANAESYSLSLIDEPESHLHPNAIAGFMQALYSVLSKTKSFSIIATHSPLILQQVPSRYISKLVSIDGVPAVMPMELETFGENVSVISDSVFKAFETPSLFKSWVLDLFIEDRAVDIADAGLELSLSARAMIEVFRRQE